MVRRLAAPLCLVMTFLLTSTIRKVWGSGVFELRLLSFSNDYGRDAEGECCNGKRTSAHRMCTGVCSTKFRVCLKHYQTTIDPNPPCTFGEEVTPVLGNNSVNMLDTSNVPGFKNPVRFSFDFSWPETFSLIIEAWHENSSIPISEGGGSRLITRLAIQRWLDVSPEWTQDSHKTNHTTMTYSFRVLCEENYYGDGCAKLCRPRNDKFGHYTCSPKGEKVCRPGWSGEYCTKAVCLAGCHEQHGQCEQPNTCKCRMGWQGKLCDQCIPYPGCQHGSCNQPWQCNCDEGWGGLFCNQDLNYCTNHKPCKNGGTCTNTGQGSYTCMCADGFTGTNCEILVDDCAQKPCMNGATCISSGQNYTCECPLGFFGRHCETQASTCTENPCQNSGTCVDGPSGYLCICQPEFHGINCEKQKNKCEPNPCRNGGSCVNKFDGFKCFCPTGFSGDRCEVNIDDCAENPCLNDGTCIDEVNKFRCTCIPGFVGDLCQTNVDDCLTKPCANGGTCHDLVNDYQCDCHPGFAGKDCSINIDECVSNPCLNGGTCVDHVVEFACLCPLGFTGPLCERVLGSMDGAIEIAGARAVQSSSIKASMNISSPAAVRDGVFVHSPQGTPTAVLEMSHQVSTEEKSRLSSQQVALIATLSAAVPLIALIAVVIIIFLRHRKRLKEQCQQDEEVCKQNEQNAVNCMNNKCLDNQIINTLGRPSQKSLKMINEDQDPSQFSRDPSTLHRTKSVKLLNTDCTCSNRTSKLLDTDSEHNCTQRTLERRDPNPPQLHSSKSESSLSATLERDVCSRNSVYVIEDHYPQSCSEDMLATEV